MTEDQKYLHGFTPKEQERLRKQARFFEHIVYKDINLSEVGHLLEVGCGVGAQTEILLRRFPDMKITGIDMSDAQLAAAGKYLETIPYAKGRYDLQKMDAASMDFDSGHFSGAFICWMLEHVPKPNRVLSEVRRVLKPGGKLYITEVMNSSFFLDPYSPNMWKYWMAFNDYQYDQAGDPFIGAKLGNLMMGVGFRNIETQIITVHLDNRHPAKRKQFIEEWTDLLLSAKEQLIQAGYVDAKTVDEMEKELKQVRRDPNAVFMYSFMQAKAVAF